jgi:hypothetical protein
MKYRILMILLLLGILGALAFVFNVMNSELQPQQSQPVPQVSNEDSAAKSFKIQ